MIHASLEVAGRVFARHTRHVGLFAVLCALLLSASVVFAAPQPFNLVGPGSPSAPGPVVDPVALQEIRWTEAIGAAEYTFSLTFPDGSVLNLEHLTPSNDGDPLRCTHSQGCRLTVNGSAVLTQNGAYSWTVTAFDSAGFTTSASNQPFFFRVGPKTAPGAFDIVGPGAPTAPGPTVTDPSAITAIQWSEALDADSYTFALTFPDASVVTLPDLNDGDELTCTGGICTLTVAGEAILTQEGNYVWTVSAINAAGVTVAANAPYFFNVRLPGAPGSFGLVFPPDAAKFDTTLPTETPIQWQAAEGALTYRWILQKVSTNVRAIGVGVVVDANDLNDGDELTCVDGVCTFVVDASVLDTGQYSWTVFAFNEAGAVEAVNGPFTFQIDLTPAQLLRNSGFENRDGRMPRRWNGVNIQNDRVNCNAGVSGQGQCAFMFVGRGDKRTVLWQDARKGGVRAGTTLTLNALVNARNLSDGADIRVIVTYADGSRARDTIAIPTNTNGVYVNLTSQPMIMSQDVKNIRVQIRYRSAQATGRFMLDNVKLWAE